MAEGGYLPEMGRALAVDHGRRLLTVAVVCAALAALLEPGHARGARSACADAVLQAWTAGTLDSRYQPACYGAALDALPEDLRAYTTASDDITRAQIGAIRAATGASEPGDTARQLASDSTPQPDRLRSFPVEVLLLTAVLLVLAGCGLGAAVLRRRRER